MITDEELQRLKRSALEGPLQSEVKRWRILELIEDLETCRKAYLRLMESIK